MNILELYSGIGGMHVAFNLSKVRGQVLCAVDINSVANSVYSYNFNNKVINGNIQSLTANFINNQDIDTVLMSPPCQPFTRNGKMMDILDPRTNSLVYFLELLPKLKIKNILLENVKGFETSETHDMLIKVLTKLRFEIKEYLLCPTECGVPNSRCRYYCVATKLPMYPVPDKYNLFDGDKKLFNLGAILETDVSPDFDVPIDVLRKHYKVIDVVHSNSTQSCCFTKSYSRYMEGTGSVLSSISKEDVINVYNNLEAIDKKEDMGNILKFDAKDQELAKLKLRFFTPKEVSRLMCFPEDFVFPPQVTTKQRYKLLGNSVNCMVVASLIKFLQ